MAEGALKKWRLAQGLSASEMADLVGLRFVNSYYRYELPFDHPRFRVPKREQMARIWVVTRGQVQANDFYYLPPLEAVESEAA